MSVPLSEITTLISRGITPKYTDLESLPVINQKCIRNGKIDFSLCRHHDKITKKVSPEKVIRNKDILINSTGVGTLGRVSQFNGASDSYTCDTHVTIVRPNAEKIDPDFLGAYLYLNQKSIEAMGHGSTGQTELSRHILGAMKIPLAVRIDQEFLGSLFSLLSKQIDLNISLIHTLETIANAIFKSWFIDFDPVREINSAGVLSLSPEIQNLFPDALVATDIGEIPSGWQVLPFSDVVDIKPKYPLKKGQSAYFIDMKCLDESSLLISDGYLRDFTSGTKFKRYDTLFARITPCLENGKTGIITSDHATDVCWGSTEFIVMTPKPFQSALFPYCWARDQALRTAAISSMSGSSGRQRVANDFFQNYLVASPSIEVQQAFKNMVDPILERIELTSKTVGNLSDLRDTLLPKLISGELRIPDAEKFLEEAGI